MQGSGLRINQGKNSRVDHVMGECSYPNVSGGEQGDPQHMLCSSQSCPTSLSVPLAKKQGKPLSNPR